MQLNLTKLQNILHNIPKIVLQLKQKIGWKMPRQNGEASTEVQLKETYRGFTVF